MKLDPISERADTILRRDKALQEGHFIVHTNNGEDFEGTTFVDLAESLKYPCTVTWFGSAILRKYDKTPKVVVALNGDFCEPKSSFASIVAFDVAECAELRLGDRKVRFYSIEEPRQVAELLELDEFPKNTRMLFISDMIKEFRLAAAVHEAGKLGMNSFGYSIIGIPTGDLNGYFPGIQSLIRMKYDWFRSPAHELEDLPVTQEYELNMTWSV